jgi:hypothetical protein
VNEWEFESANVGPVLQYLLWMGEDEGPRAFTVSEVHSAYGSSIFPESVDSCLRSLERERLVACESTADGVPAFRLIADGRAQRMLGRAGEAPAARSRPSGLARP